MTEFQAHQLHDYCMKVMDDAREGRAIKRKHKDSTPTDCADLFTMRAAESGQVGRSGAGGGSGGSGAAGLVGGTGGKGGNAY